MDDAERSRIASHCRADSWRAQVAWLAAVQADVGLPAEAVVSWLDQAPAQAMAAAAQALRAMGQQRWRVERQPGDPRLSLRVRLDGSGPGWQLRFRPSDPQCLCQVLPLPQDADAASQVPA
jgi:predicted pyridoxine 5'-phosphate oxidase superfamily flavin-nucleotide-binding protein